MDEAVKKTLVLALMAIASAGAAAQALQDPTRPPAAAAAGHAPPRATRQRSAACSRCWSARAPGGRHLAVIDGETVRLGEQFHGARVTRIGENEVELVRGANARCCACTRPIRRAA
jgi:MSHA biogenesis protein MshK